MNLNLHKMWNDKRNGEHVPPEKAKQGHEPQFEPKSVLLKQTKPR
jgi:hypothetical protein